MRRLFHTTADFIKKITMRRLLPNTVVYTIAVIITLTNSFTNTPHAIAIYLDGEIDTQTPYILLRVRKMFFPQDEERFETEKDAQHQLWLQKIPLSQVAFLLMDVWAHHGNDGLKKRMDTNIREKLFPVVKAARKHGVLIIHAPHDQDIHPLLTPLPGEIVIQGVGKDENQRKRETKQLTEIMTKNNILFLIYVGYVSNMCVINRGSGLFAMRDRSYMNILVRDASLAIEAPETLSAQATHALTIFTIELNALATTTTVDDIVSAFNAVHQPDETPLPQSNQ